MYSERAFAVLTMSLTILGLSFALLVGQASAGPAVIEIAGGEIDTNLGALESAVSGGDLQLAGRVEDAGFFYAWEPVLRALEAKGVDYSVVLEDAAGVELYLVSKACVTEPADLALRATVLRESGSFFLVSVKPDEASGIYDLAAKKMLPFPTEPSLPLRAQRMAGEAAQEAAFSYSSAVQNLADQVSQTNLYNLLRGLSGEDEVEIGGELRTITTRYSPTPQCRNAADYLKEQFEALGVAAEYDYFNFRKFLYGVDFPEDGLDGWIVGGSVILRTTNGGQSWVKQEDGLDGTLTALFMFDEETGLVGASDGSIARTDDGWTWQAVTSPTANNIAAISFADALTGYMCGGNGTILKSTDGGTSWTKLTSGTTADLTGIWFTSATSGWVVGTGGVIRKTTNGGSSWQAVTSPVTTKLTEIVFTSPTQGIVTGLSGVILRTTDGATWQRIGLPVTDDLYGIFFLDQSIGWACGDGGAIIKTVNGGAYWSDQSTFINYEFRDVCFAGASEGWAVGNSVVAHSLDGGASWQSQNNNIEAGDVNVVATLPGTTHPEEIYIILAHYDDTSPIPYDYAPGADDNGTGTIATVEAARVLKDTDFEATIKFLAVSREEQGLVGSNAYAQEAYARGDSIVGALNFDMIGYMVTTPQDIDIIHNGVSAWLADAYEEAANLYVPEMSVVQHYAPGFSSSDNASFWTYGYSSFCGIEDATPDNPYYHTTWDRVSTLNFTFFRNAVRAAVACLAEMARIDSVTASVPVAGVGAEMTIGPNPGRGEIAIEMAAGAKGAGSVGVYDVAGRLVRDLKTSVSGGTARAVWHGDDASGATVSPGIYFFKPQGSERSTKVVLVR